MSQSASHETVRVAFVCAHHDLPYLKEGARGADGMFRVVRTFRLKVTHQTRAAASMASAAPSPAAPEIPAAQWDWGDGSPCPYCGALGFVRCWQCGTLVCNGKTRYPDQGAAFFICRDSCGYMNFVQSRITAYPQYRDSPPRPPLPGPAARFKALPKS